MSGATESLQEQNARLVAVLAPFLTEPYRQVYRYGHYEQECMFCEFPPPTHDARCPTQDSELMALAQGVAAPPPDAQPQPQEER